MVMRLQHVSVPRPPGADADRQAIEFYRGLLGLEHVPKPATFTNIDVTWFRIGDAELHVFAVGPGDTVAHSGSHFCLEVRDPSATRGLLEGHGYRCNDTAPIPNRPRFMSHDPFGNYIEFTSIRGDYRDEDSGNEGQRSADQ